MAQRVYIAFRVQCNCPASAGHEQGIEGAPVEVQVIRGNGLVDKTLYGRTERGGWFIEKYERDDVYPLSDMIGSVLACGQKVSLDNFAVTASISPEGILDFFSDARGLQWPDSTPQGILDALNLTVPVSTDLQMWLITKGEPFEVECHADCSQLTSHSSELILSGDGKPYAGITVSETFERIIFGRNRKKYTYRVRNTETGNDSLDRIISDFRICFESPEALENILSATGPTRSWKSRKDGNCLVFEVSNDAFGIQPTQSGDFIIEVLASAEEGKVEVTVSWLRFDGTGHENLTEPNSVPGPAFAMLDKGDSSSILMVTGDLPATLSDGVKGLLSAAGRRTYEVQDPERKMTTLIATKVAKAVPAILPSSRFKPSTKKIEDFPHSHKHVDLSEKPNE